MDVILAHFNTASEAVPDLLLLILCPLGSSCLAPEWCQQISWKEVMHSVLTRHWCNGVPPPPLLLQCNATQLHARLAGTGDPRRRPARRQLQCVSAAARCSENLTRLFSVRPQPVSLHLPQHHHHVFAVVVVVVVIEVAAGGGELARLKISYAACLSLACRRSLSLSLSLCVCVPHCVCIPHCHSPLRLLPAWVMVCPVSGARSVPHIHT